MKRANDLLPWIAEPENLRLACWKAAKGKRYSQAVLSYQANLEENLRDLRRKILSAQVAVGDYRYFKVYEPKERKICASAFREQVLHHALMNVCHDFFDAAQIHDSYASRKGKGTYAALGRAGAFTAKHDWYLKLDVRKFFETIHHNVLKNQLDCLFKEKDLLTIFFTIIDSYEASPGRGVPIGNLTSQYFANHYLSGLDHFIKEKLRIKSYVRYMDDMVLWHSEKKPLIEANEAISDYVTSRLLCELKPPALNRTEKGLPFLGYHLFPRYVHLLQKSEIRFIRKLRVIQEHYDSGAWSEEACQRRALPLLAFVMHADTKRLRKNVLLKL
jgi:RNA-directed DNA polymerase